MFGKKKYKLRQPGAVIPAVVLSAVFGLAAGIVGMLVMLAYFPLISPPGSTGLGSAVGPAVHLQGGRTSAEFAIKDLAASSAVLYRSEDVGQVTLVGKAVGSGIVLTSDGWILSHSSALEAANRRSGQGLTAMVNGATYEIEKAVIDTYTGVAFLRAKGANLPVASFGKSDQLATGDMVFSLDVSGGLREADLTAVGSLPAVDVASAYRSSEKIQRVLRLSEVDSFVPGAALLNASGEAMGIYVGDSTVGAYAIPMDAILRQIGLVLRDSEVARPYLGVRFLDLSEHRGVDGPTRGAQLKSYGRLASILRSSPAAESGLRENDIIKAVNGEWVTVNKSLPDLIVEYEPEEVITLTILRANEELDIEVTLAKMPSL